MSVPAAALHTQLIHDSTHAGLHLFDIGVGCQEGLIRSTLSGLSLASPPARLGADGVQELSIGEG